jgi:hypothetical protein
LCIRSARSSTVTRRGFCTQSPSLSNSDIETGFFFYFASSFTSRHSALSTTRTSPHGHPATLALSVRPACYESEF